jgi:hypothetical protein
MTRAPILFRVDAAPRLGWTHLSRCLTLAAAIQRRRRPCFFLSQLEPGSLGLSIKRGGNDWLDAGYPAGTPDDLEELIQEVRRLRPVAVVIDAPDAKEDYLAALRNTGVMLVSLDNLAHIIFPSRLIVNPLLGPSKDSYEYGPGAQLMLGHRYALVRPEIRRQRPTRSQEPPQPFRALIALGDDDPNNQSGELAKMLNRELDRLFPKKNEIIDLPNLNFFSGVSKALLSEVGLKGVLFFDYGNSFNDKSTVFDTMLMSYGLGIRWASPIGPLRLEYGIPINPRSNIDSTRGRLEFSIGTMF